MTDPLLGMLLPVWQLAIGLFVVAAVVVAGVRLAQRGPSRITTGLLVTGAAIVAICALSFLL